MITKFNTTVFVVVGSRSGVTAECKYWIINRNCGAVDCGGCSIDGQVTANNQVVMELTITSAVVNTECSTRVAVIPNIEVTTDVCILFYSETTFCRKCDSAIAIRSDVRSIADRNTTTESSVTSLCSSTLDIEVTVDSHVCANCQVLSDTYTTSKLCSTAKGDGVTSDCLISCVGECIDTRRLQGVGNLCSTTDVDCTRNDCVAIICIYSKLIYARTILNCKLFVSSIDD